MSASFHISNDRAVTARQGERVRTVKFIIVMVWTLGGCTALGILAAFVSPIFILWSIPFGIVSWILANVLAGNYRKPTVERSTPVQAAAPDEAKPKGE